VFLKYLFSAEHYFTGLEKLQKIPPDFFCGGIFKV